MFKQTKEKQLLSALKETPAYGFVYGILGDIKKHNSTPDQLEKDLKRSGKVSSEIEENDLTAMASYFRQAMLSVATYAVMANSSQILSLGSFDQRIHFCIFRKPQTKDIILRVFIDDPNFTVNTGLIDKPREKEAFVAVIPGRITFDYQFYLNHPKKKGFELTELTFSNEILRKLIMEQSPAPEKNPEFYTRENFRSLAEEANILTIKDLKKFFKTAQKIPTQFFDVATPIGKPLEQEIPLYIHHLVAQNSQLELSLAPENKFKARIVEEHGNTLLRFTLKNPLFMTSTSGKTIPGTITTDFHFDDLSQAYQLKSISFSNHTLMTLVLQPPKYLTEETLNWSYESASRQEKLPYREILTDSEPSSPTTSSSSSSPRKPE